MTFNRRINLLSKYIVWTGAGIVGLWMLTLGFPDEAAAMLVVLFTATIALAVCRHYTEEKEFITPANFP